MAEREFIFRQGSKELILPVTPDSYTVGTGINVEIVNIHELGDAILTGYGTLATIKINCMLPANAYSFARDDDPEPYISQFEKWVKQKRRLRFIVGGTGVNIPVVIKDFSYGETDGTNDIYADLSLREYPVLTAPQVTAAAAGASTARAASDSGGSSVQSYTAVYGDTLSGICRKFYGNGTADYYNRLAKYNGKANPNILMTGEVLKIPTPLP